MGGRLMAVGIAALALGAMTLTPAGATSGVRDATSSGQAQRVSTAAAAPASATTPGAATRASAAAAARLQLTVHPVSDATVSAMDATFTNTSVDTVVNTVNHHLHAIGSSACTSSEAATAPSTPTVAADSTYCWDEGDATTQYWSPQGMTSSGDADGDGLWGTDRVVVSGWGSANTSPAMGRLALINETAGSANKDGYRWVLPVIPTDGGTDFARFGSHMGGMVWWGDKLLITASLDGDAHHNAIYVFSTQHIYQANTDASWIGHEGSETSADGYQYFWPAIGSYSVDASCNYTDHSDGRLPCFDGLSMDRSTSPYTLVANEWVSSGATDATSRIWRYQLAPAGDAMPISVNSAGTAAPLDVYDTDIIGIQGTLDQTENGEKVVYTADALGSPQARGLPWRVPLPATGAQSAAHVSTSTGGSATGQGTWAQHTEGMTYMSDQSRAWVQTEWAADKDGKWPTSDPVRQRIVFDLPVSDLRAALTG